jgi:hypothetical protein
MVEKTAEKRLLVLNCHEAWIYQLSWLGYGLDIIIGLKGQKQHTWDIQMRPKPDNCQFLSLESALHSPTNYECIIAHNFTDLLDIKTRREPRIIVLHSTLEGRRLEENSRTTSAQMRTMLDKYTKMTGTHAVAVSSLKGHSWQQTKDIIPFGIDTADYLEWKGDKASGLRICNYITSRSGILLWDFHEKAFGQLPVTLVGHNPDIPQVNAAQSWLDLKKILQNHRFYIHTANPLYEDGYNMATLEAMASGLCVLGNKHPTSIVNHGVDGFLSDDPAELRGYATKLLNDQQLAREMGQEAKKTVASLFSTNKFCESFKKSIATARQKWKNINA